MPTADLPADHRAGPPATSRLPLADPEAAPSAEWLNLTQAAQRLGWPRERLRSQARRGRLQTKRGNTSELFVLLTPELVDLAQAEPKADLGPTAAVADADHLRDRVAELEDQVADLRVDLARAEERAKAAETTARVEIEATRRAAEAQIAATEGASQGKEAALRELIAELRSEMASLRLPFWRRWLMK